MRDRLRVVARPLVLLLVPAVLPVVPVSAGTGTATAQEVPEPDTPDAPDGPGGGRTDGSAGSHVVRIAEGTSPADLADALEPLDGAVVDVLEPLDLALVDLDDPADGTGDRTDVDGADDPLDQVVALDDVTGGSRNRVVGATDEPGAPASPTRPTPPRRPDPADLTPGERLIGGSARTEEADRQEVGADPLEEFQWGNEMVGATVDGAHRGATGAGVTVAVIDTGVDGTHPDVADNLDLARSRDIVDRADGVARDPLGHGTHVAGIVGAPRNGTGIAGVAPDVTLLNLRAGDDAGYFFVYEVAEAIVLAADRGADVAVMSFYTDPWLYNCASADDYVSGEVTDDEIAEQALVREILLDATAFAHDQGVTLIAAAGNEYTDLAAPTRDDSTSPDVPAGSAQPRTVTRNCLDLPSEAPDVLSVSAVGPSGTKADYSNYGLGSIAVAAPGGWFRDLAGAADFQTPGNLVLSAYPLEAALVEGLADPEGQPVDSFSQVSCRDEADPASCGFYTYLQGTSMAAPHAAGVAALIVERHGARHGDGPALPPARVEEILLATADPQPCPPDGFVDYASAGRPESWNAACVGSSEENSLYGRGIVDAAAAVR